MKVIFHEDFYQVYTSDPAAASGRMEAVIDVIASRVEILKADMALDEDISAVHTKYHIAQVKNMGLYEISALAAGGAIQAATIGLQAPSFGLIRPPGHHASANSSWGFCFFNNMAIALDRLKRENKIRNAYVLDIDLHYGDGTVNILENKGYATTFNVTSNSRKSIMEEITNEMSSCSADIIGISAGFDNHKLDWGGILATDDYYEIGRMTREASQDCGGGCFGILEGGYNHDVLGDNVMALINGLEGKGKVT